LATILPGDSYRLTSLLGESGVIYYPGHHRVTPQHCGDYQIQTAIQDRFVIPRGVGYHMMQRLVHPTHVIASESRGHGFDAFPFSGQQQAGAVVLQRSATIGMPCGFGQALDICRKALFLWAWRSLFAHETILHQVVIL
jgi:hypothetical protein